MSNFKLYILATLSLIVLSSSTAYSRWATPAEAPVEYEFFNRDVNVEENKTEDIVEYQMKIINESGRESYGTTKILFSDDSEKLELIEAKTIYNGVEDRGVIADTKPISSSEGGFDSVSQMVIAFPQAFIGARLYLKYKRTILKQPLPNYFQEGFSYSRGEYFKKSHVSLKSKLPFKLWVNDPNHDLTIKEKKEKDYQTITIDLKRPIYKSLTQEHGSLTALKLDTNVIVTTLDSFEAMGKAIAPKYEQVINQPLPPLLENIKISAQKITDEAAQINAVTTGINEKIRYVGDWRTIEGGFFPRSLATIVKLGMADCKEFSVATAAILNSLGYKAQVALVTRGSFYQKRTLEAPAMNFNHAMLKVTNKNGKIFWIDPTNFVSMADGLFDDISNRPALILDSQNPHLEDIPENDYKHNTVEKDRVITILNDKRIRIQGKNIFKGEYATEWTGAALNQPIDNLKEHLFRMLAGETAVFNKKITLPDLSSRNVKDLTIDYTYEIENETLFTNSGMGFLINSTWANGFLRSAQDPITSYFIGTPRTELRKIIIKNVQVQNIDSLNFHMETPWANIRRECRKLGKDIEVKESLETFTRFISPKQLKSKKFKEFRDTLKKYCTNVAVVLEKN